MKQYTIPVYQNRAVGYTSVVDAPSNDMLVSAGPGFIFLDWVGIRATISHDAFDLLRHAINVAGGPWTQPHI